MAASTQLTSTPRMRSRRLPVGNNAPVLEPTTSMKLSRIGAALPGTPSMTAPPSYSTRPPGVSTTASMSESVLTLRICTTVLGSSAATNPRSMAKGPTPASMLPQVGP